MWYAPSAFNFIENQTLLQVFLTPCNETNGPRSQRTQHIKKHVLKPLNKLRTNSKLLQYNDFVVHRHHFVLTYKYDIIEDILFWKKQVLQSQFWWGFFFFLWLFVLRCTSRPNFITFLQRLGLFFFVEQLHH